MKVYNVTCLVGKYQIEHVPNFFLSMGSDGTPYMEAHKDETQKFVQNKISPDGIDKSDYNCNEIAAQ